MSDFPFRNIYSNDTTNIATCISPYHKTRGGKLGREEVQATVKEVAGKVDAHFIQLAHGQVPWYKSRYYPHSEHLKWWKEYFEVTDEQINAMPELYGYVRDGGDILQDFIDACRECGQAPFVSLRLNDGHHIEWCETKGHVNGIHSINKFLVEHRHMMLGKDLTKWSERTLNWKYDEPRERMLALITEQCEDYDIDGFELDFLRHPYYFRVNETSLEERVAIMDGFISKVRAILDRTERNGKRRYLCVRVPSNLKVWDEIGLVPEHMESLGVDMVNVSSFFYADQWMHYEEFISRMPGLAVYFEITNTTLSGKSYGGYDCDVLRRITENEILSTARLAYAAGAQGVSFFNFVYFREYGNLPELRGPFNEPPFEAVGKVRDRELVENAPSHFYIAKGWGGNTQLGGKCFLSDKEYPFEIYIQEPAGGFNGELRFRAVASKPLGNRTLSLVFNGKACPSCSDVSEPYEEDLKYPPLHGNEENTRAWIVSKEAIRNGKNIFTLKWTSDTDKEPVEFHYMDIFPITGEIQSGCP